MVSSVAILLHLPVAGHVDVPCLHVVPNTTWNEVDIQTHWKIPHISIGHASGFTASRMVAKGFDL